MALGFYFSPTSMNAQQYDTCIRKLEVTGAGSQPQVMPIHNVIKG